jgi:hypothetical protein
VTDPGCVDSAARPSGQCEPERRRRAPRDFGEERAATLRAAARRLDRRRARSVAIRTLRAAARASSLLRDLALDSALSSRRQSGRGSARVRGLSFRPDRHITNRRRRRHLASPEDRDLRHSRAAPRAAFTSGSPVAWRFSVEVVPVRPRNIRHGRKSVGLAPEAALRVGASSGGAAGEDRDQRLG